MISNAGDINGDGIDDIIIGATSTDPGGRNNAGTTYVVFGTETPTATIDLAALDGSNGFVINGIDSSKYIGENVSNAGDINADGFDDIILGAYTANSYSGQSYIIYGGDSFDAELEISDLDGSNGYTVDGIDISDHLGISVSFAGDVNADGYDDYIIGAVQGDSNGRSNNGETYVIFGSDSLLTSFDPSTLDGSNGFIVTGDFSGDSLGYSVSYAGDMNGDGFDDVIIGSSGAAASYVVYGSANPSASINVTALDGTNGFKLSGIINNNDAFGYSVSHAGDINGDGFDDVIIGAQYFDGDVIENIGASYVVYGSNNASAELNMYNLDGTNGFSIAGYGEYHQMGHSVSSAGDVNGDGYDDILVSSINASPGGVEDAGQSYIIYGGPTVHGVTQGTSGNDTITGSAGADQIIAGAGDDTITSGGGADVIYGASGDDEIIVAGTTFFRIDGGLGTDTLTFTGSDLDINLKDANIGIKNIDVIDITGSGDNSLTIDNADVGQIADSKTLRIIGDAGDSINIGEGWSRGNDFTEGSIDYQTYIIGAIKIEIATAISITETVSVQGEFNLSEINGYNGLRIVGIDGSDGSGYSVSDAGDINGDGYDDFIIGAERADPDGRTDASESYIIFGSASLGNQYAPTLFLEDLNGTNGFVIKGIDNDDRAGNSVSSAGDVNGDGYDDIIIGAQRADGGGVTDAGEAYIVYGGASFSSSLELSLLDGSDGVILYGEAESDWTGHSVSNIGDINNDGYDDVIISAYLADPNSNAESGKVYVVFGSDSLSASIDLSGLDGNTGFAINGLDANHRLGDFVSNVGDFNNDGIDDFIVGATGVTNYTGEAYLIFGGQSFGATFDLTDLDGSNGMTITGASFSDRIGSSLGGAGDVNGDGIDDIILGASFGDPDGRSDAGESFVVYGTETESATLNLSSLDGNNGFVINGIDEDDRTGLSVSMACDVNGDGIDDMIIGTFLANGNDGESYLVYGSDSFGSSFELSSLNGTNGFIINPITADDEMGYSVSGAGDINGDGYDDIIIGAPEAKDDSGPAWVGETYIIYGGRTSTTTLQGTNADDTFAGTGADDSMIGGEGNDTLDGNAGDDHIDGNNGNDTLTGGQGIDIVSGGNGLDTFVFEAGDSDFEYTLSLDTSDIDGILNYDVISDFKTNSATDLSETYQVIGGATIAVDTAGFDGTDVNEYDATIGDILSVKSHAISDGIITFDDEDTYATALTGTEIDDNSELAILVKYIQGVDLGDAGATVAFDFGEDTYVFTQGDDAGTDELDILVKLEGVQIDSLIDSNTTGDMDLYIL